MMAMNATSFGIQDSIFGLDISYFMFQKPVIEMMVFYFVTFMIGLTLYIALYYIIVFFYVLLCDGVIYDFFVPIGFFLFVPIVVVII